MPSAIDEIQAADHALTQTDLERRAFPLVIRGLCHQWPVVEAARTSDTTFATLLAGYDNGADVDTLLLAPEENGVIGYNAAMDGFNYRHFRVPITEVLRRLAAYSRHDGATPGVALQSALIADCMPDFATQHSLPLPHSAIQPRLWIGNRVTTPAHFDASYNLAVTVCGRRRFTLFAPEQVSNLYIGPLDFAPTGAAISMARLDQAEDPRFPQLQQALDHAVVAELEPGDAIYIPPLWWHHVSSLARLNALVNYWWKPATSTGLVPESGMGALLHAILALKSLPNGEREAWKRLFNHYVFGNDDPARHIPAERRNLLGPLTAKQVEELKQKIRAYLR